ncbi:MAG: lipase family protein [Pseudonocardiaceae bacterium]
MRGNSPVVDKLMKWQHSGSLRNATKAAHADNHAIATPLAALAGYVYAKDVKYLTKIANKIFNGDAKPLDERNISVDRFQATVDGMLIESTADLVRIRTATGGHLGVVCYRGTIPEDLISILGVLELGAKQFDAKDKRNPVPTEWEGSVHSGFYRNFIATRDEVVEALNVDLRGGRRGDGQKDDFGELEALYLSGHSLGGAMAVLMAMTLATEHKEIWGKLRGVFTFGQPMVGDGIFAGFCKGKLDSRLIRYIYCKDIVPHLPPDLSTGDFKHVGDEYRYERGQEGWKYSQELAKRGGWKVILTPVSYLERRVAFLSRVQRLLPFGLPYSIDDHSPNGYIDTFENLL